MKILREISTDKPLSSPDKVYKYLNEFKDQDREMFIVIGLDTRNIPCYREIVSIGTLNNTVVHPREVFKKAVMLSCNSIILAHNHPSGDPEPSEEDKTTTHQLVEAGKILGIQVLDHVILGRERNYSFNDNGELK